jgi:hypothetical protein
LSPEKERYQDLATKRSSSGTPNPKLWKSKRELQNCMQSLRHDWFRSYHPPNWRIYIGRWLPR